MKDSQFKTSSLPITTPIVVIIGPTAVGKTNLSLSIANEFSAEIVGADSMQVFRYMDIGTAKPSKEEQQQADHHLIDVADPDEDYHAGRYAEESLSACRSIIDKGKMPLVVGGTGLYIKALLEGMIESLPIDKNIREELKERLEKEGREVLYAELNKTDPDSASRIHPNDTQRLLRALEIFQATGVLWSTHIENEDKKGQFSRVLKIGLTCEREKLYERINMRAQMMMDAGFLEEVQGLLDMGYGPDLKSMQSLGYRHCLQYIEGNWDLETTFSLLARDTRRYAKRQYTWFGKDKDVFWVSPEDKEEVFAHIQGFLGTKSTKV